ncbi:MAG: helix-turn-helix transcriptional regulator [Clostridia bacterium]|nr:helix-turn-helix transcriptional regulator [Clostridia bacterium]
MAQILLNPFDHRQYMRRENFEIFHYNNPGSCSCAPHRHDFFELYYLLGDEMDYIVDGLRYPLREGCVMLMAPGQIHRPDVHGPVRNLDRFVLWLSADYVRAITGTLPHFRYALLGDMTGRNLLQPDAETSAMMRALLFALQRDSAGSDPDSAVLCRSIVTQLLIYCVRSISRAPEAPPHRAEHRYHEIIRIYEYIGAHLGEPLSVAGLAEQFFMDKNTLTRQFKRQVGMTPGDYIRRRRLETARALIHDGTSMQEACADCGFSDYSAFYRAFRQAFGMGPSDYAAQCRGAAAPADVGKE